VWSLAFYLLENFEGLLPDKTWGANVIQVAVSMAGQLSTPRGIFLLVLSGLERLIVGGKCDDKVVDQVLKLVSLTKHQSQ
jgi:hypothetical protein